MYREGFVKWSEVYPKGLLRKEGAIGFVLGAGYLLLGCWGVLLKEPKGLGKDDPPKFCTPWDLQWHKKQLLFDSTWATMSFDLIRTNFLRGRSLNPLHGCCNHLKSRYILELCYWFRVKLWSVLLVIRNILIEHLCDICIH